MLQRNVMDGKERQDEYLAKAREAADQAVKPGEEASRESWLLIAAGYDDLAARQCVAKP